MLQLLVLITRFSELLLADFSVTQLALQKKKPTVAARLTLFGFIGSALVERWTALFEVQWPLNCEAEFKYGTYIIYTVK